MGTGVNKTAVSACQQQTRTHSALSVTRTLSHRHSPALPWSNHWWVLVTRRQTRSLLRTGRQDLSDRGTGGFKQTQEETAQSDGTRTQLSGAEGSSQAGAWGLSVCSSLGI